MRRLVRRAGVAGTTGGLDARDAVVHFGQHGELRVRLVLIPIGDGVEIVGAMVGVAVLDGGAQGLGERDW